MVTANQSLVLAVGSIEGVGAVVGKKWIDRAALGVDGPLIIGLGSQPQVIRSPISQLHVPPK